MNDAEIRLQVTFDSSKAEKSVKTLSQKADDLSKKFTSAGKSLTVGLTTPITAFGTYAVKMASDLSEVQNVVDTTFKESSNTINEFAKNAAEKFGLSELSAKQFTGTMGAMLKSMGLGNQEVTDMSMALAGLAGDMASFYNLDPTEAFEKLRSGISGETEPLKQLGINMSVVNLEAFAMSQGIEKSYDSMTQAEQATLRYQYIMATTADAQGDYAKTADSTANKTRTTMLQFQSLAAELGKELLPLVNDLLSFLQGIIKWFNKLSPAGKKVTLVLAGIAAAIGPISLAIGTLIKTGMMISQLVTLIKSWQIATNLMSIAQGALNAVMALSPITWIILGIMAIIAAIVLLWNNCEWFREAVIGIFNTVVNVIQAVIDFFANNWQGILLFMVNPFAGAFKLLYDNFAGFRNFIDGIVNSVRNMFTSFANGVKSAFQAVRDFIVTIFSSIGGIIKAPINGVIDLINSALRGMNKIKVPDWVPGVGGAGINFPMIPKLNVGTNYVAREGLAYLHQGEAVVPKKYNPALGGNGGATYVTVVADMDVNKFGKAFVKEVKTFSGGAKNSYNYGGAR